jgi:dihydropyrimidinase
MSASAGRPGGLDPYLLDLVIRGGTAITTDGRFQADIGIKDGVVAQIGPGPMRARREIDARGRLLLPGGIDPHVHLTCSDATELEPAWVDDFHSGSAAALAGGITTIGNMSFVLPSETPAERMRSESDDVARLAIADVFLHPVILAPRPATRAQLAELAADGVTSMKMFMCFPSFDGFGGEFTLLMRAAGEAGMMTLIHCEDLGLIECCTALLAARSQRAVCHLPESRPVLSELMAVQRALAMCEATGAPTYIVHLSSARALEACTDARRRGLPVYVETRPIYLHFTRDRYQDEEGPLFVAQPPLRDAADRDELWAALADGRIDTLASDHAPWTRAMKMDPEHNLSNLRPGLAELETMLPLLFSEGVRRGRLSLERFVEVTSTNAARLFGLYPRKGTIALGSDADLVVWNTEQPRTIRGSEMHSRAAHTVYEGRRLDAWPEITVRRGEVVFEHGRIAAAPGSGRLVRRERVSPDALRPPRPAESAMGGERHHAPHVDLLCGDALGTQGTRRAPERLKAGGDQE